MQGNVDFFVQRTISWDDARDSVSLVDQTLLPEKFELIECSTVQSLIHAIKTMQIRGAPAIGVAGAMGIALSLLEGIKEGRNEEEITFKIHRDADAIVNARPTAVNLSWGVKAALDYIKSLRESSAVEESKKLISFVKKLADQDVEINKTLGEIGKKLLRDDSSVLTHCN